MDRTRSAMRSRIFRLYYTGNGRSFANGCCLLKCAPTPVSAGYDSPQRPADGLSPVWTASARPAPSPPAGAASDECIATAGWSSAPATATPAAAATAAAASATAATCSDADRRKPPAEASSAPYCYASRNDGASGAARHSRQRPSPGYAARWCCAVPAHGGRRSRRAGTRPSGEEEPHQHAVDPGGGAPAQADARCREELG